MGGDVFRRRCSRRCCRSTKVREEHPVDRRVLRVALPGHQKHVQEQWPLYLEKYPRHQDCYL